MQQQIKISSVKIVYQPKILLKKAQNWSRESEKWALKPHKTHPLFTRTEQTRKRALGDLPLKSKTATATANPKRQSTPMLMMQIGEKPPSATDLHGCSQLRRRRPSGHADHSPHSPPHGKPAKHANTQTRERPLRV